MKNMNMIIACFAITILGVLGCNSNTNPTMLTSEDSQYSKASNVQSQALAHLMAGFSGNEFKDINKYHQSLLPISKLTENHTYAVVLDHRMAPIQMKMLMEKLWSISDRVFFVNDVTSAWKLPNIEDVYECSECHVYGDEIQVGANKNYASGGGTSYQFIFKMENGELTLRSITLISIQD
jgi:hypothetical protein